MMQSKPRLLPENLQNRFLGFITPLIKALGRRGFHPNTFTLAGLILTLMAAAALLKGHLRTSGLLILAGGLCDCIDGNLARATDQVTRFGGLFDSAIDRYSELVMFFGILAYFLGNHEYFMAVTAFLAMAGSTMVSYSRARAESLGFEASMGWMQRPERVVLIGTGALIHPILFKFAILLVAIFANLTALQRIRAAYQQNKTQQDRGN